MHESDDVGCREDARREARAPGSLARRDVLRLGGGGIAAAALGGLLSACGSSVKVSKKPSSSSSVAARAGTGGTIGVASYEEPISLDAVVYVYRPAQMIFRQTNESLYQWQPGGGLKPLLAAAMPVVSSDGLTATIKLRSGVKFHNDKTFGSDDVKFTYDLIMKPTTGSNWSQNFALVKSVEAPSSDTVVISLTSPFADLAGALANPVIVPSNVAYDSKTYARSIIGTGPFSFKEWKSGQEVVLERFPDYWGKGLPKAAGVVFRFVTDEASRLADVVNGVDQLLPEVPSDELSVAKGKGLQTFVGDHSDEGYWIWPNLAPGRPTANVDLRRAISYAIDRSAIVDTIFHGQGAPTSSAIEPGMPYYTAKYGNYFGTSGDKAKARQLVAAAGSAAKQPLQLITTSSQVTGGVAELVQRDLQSVGLDVKLVEEGLESWFPLLLKGDYDMVLYHGSAQNAIGFASYNPFGLYYSKSSLDLEHFASPEMDSALLAAMAAPASQAASAWQKVQAIEVQEVPMVWIVAARYLEAWSPRLKGYSEDSIGCLEDLKYASL